VKNKNFYVIENALLNLGKNKGRNFLQGVMIFAVITTTVIALSIHNTSVAIIGEYKTRFGSEVNIVPETLADNLPDITAEQALLYSQSEYLRDAQVDEVKIGSGAIKLVYYLKSPESLDAFRTEVQDKGLPAGYIVDIDKAGYDRMVMPMEGLKDISLTFLLIVLALGCAIMILLSIISVRERKYEIGVLRAMGMKKQKLAMGLWVEILIITSVCFILSLIAGGLLSQSISDALLAGLMNTATEPVDISVSPQTVLQIFGVAMLFASVAGIISVSKITKYEPIKILMERN
jgi:putative ABC transport system permease protein